MVRYARIQNGKVVEVGDFDSIEGRFHPSLVWVECPVDFGIGDLYDGQGFSHPPAPEVPAAVVIVSPRQIRQALTRAGLRGGVEAAVAAGDQDLKDWWEFATQFERDHPQVVAMGTALGQTSAELDALFELARSL